jgi:predicted metal-dependent enzyme (double-stranded beta helix superfamily)
MFTLAGFIDDCRAALKDAAPELAVNDLLERTMACPAEVEAALGTPRKGEIVSLHRSAELTILNVIWTPGMAIYPYEHRMWAAIGLYGGREDNTFYRRSPTGLAVAGHRTVDTQDVLILGQAAIHAVANPLRKLTGAIHLYGGDFFAMPRSEWDPETLEERPFDIERARTVYAQANAQWAAELARAGAAPPAR